jgi:outer membrane biosynthesis protein TonB
MINLEKAIFVSVLAFGLVLARPPASVSAEGQETARKIVKKVAPVYSAVARGAHLTGTVKLVLNVAPDGTVKSLRTVGGNAVLALAAEQAAKQWKFETAKADSVEMIAVAFGPLTE